MSRDPKLSMNGATSGYEEEHVTYIQNEDKPNWFLPKIETHKKSGLIVKRDFEPTDMPRVLDYEEAGGGRVAAVQDEEIMIGDYVGDGTGQISFPGLYTVLRGAFLFCFNEEDVEQGEGGGRYTTYENPPVCIIPLDHIEIQFPPGGRRVFREHAHTTAQTGYELIILHNPPDDSETERRPPAFLVTDSLSKRNKWAEAMKFRSKLNKPTLLRAGYTAAAAAVVAAEDPLSQSNRVERKRDAANQNGTKQQTRKDEMLAMATQEDTSKPIDLTLRNRARNRESKSMEKKIMEVSDDADLASAVVEFGVAEFNEKEWMDNFYQNHNEIEAAETCTTMEKWLHDMKKSLKGAVLEQYEYFVQASGQMTTMGEEVTALKIRIETQVDLIKEMKEIDFMGALRDDDKPDKDELMGRDDDSAGSMGPDAGNEPFYSDDLNEMMNRHRGLYDEAEGHENKNKTAAPPIEVPEWIEDVDEEIAATIRECRYDSAIELYLKANSEINELIDKHERPTAYRLTKKQLNDLKALRKVITKLGNRISNRLQESLRRKNEAMKQASRRDRNDASAVYAPVVSPCSLNDDALYLQLLVKLGRTQEAAEVYTARRTLLLLETLQERPLSGAGTVDLVIYAAQLSQSFFSCLANSVEGFLDLFLTATAPIILNGDKSEDSDASSLHSTSLGQNSKNLPAGVVSYLVLWCDSELSKFAMAFGGTRILSNLSLSPPKGVDTPKGPRVVGNNGSNIDTSRDRKNAIELAAQCLDQAFLYASQNLDSVGLPLTPRLAEMIRVRLKGCEQEVSLLLDERWHSMTLDWRSVPDDEPHY